MGELSFGGLKRAIPVGIFVVLVDQITKSWAVSNLSAGSCSQSEDACIDLFGDVRFHLVYNKGAAFSQGLEYGRWFAVLALVMTVFLLWAAYSESSRFSSSVYGLLAGGALGNFLDRAFRSTDGFLGGGVVDFIDVGWFPIFNIADSAIVGGICALLFLNFYPLFSKKSERDVLADTEQNTA